MDAVSNDFGLSVRGKPRGNTSPVDRLKCPFIIHSYRRRLLDTLSALSVSNPSEYCRSQMHLRPIANELNSVKLKLIRHAGNTVVLGTVRQPNTPESVHIRSKGIPRRKYRRAVAVKTSLARWFARSVTALSVLLFSSFINYK